MKTIQASWSRSQTNTTPIAHPPPVDAKVCTDRESQGKKRRSTAKSVPAASRRRIFGDVFTILLMSFTQLECFRSKTRR